VAQAPPEVEATVRQILAELFPDRDTRRLTADDDLASSLGIDSMAMIDVALEVERRTGLHVPDEDLARLTSIGAVVGYVAAHSPAPE
jgi:acyl carrier protein